MLYIESTKVGYKLANPLLGNEVIVDEIAPFTKHKVAVVGKYGRCGLINDNAELIIPIEYDSVMVAGEDIVICKRKKQYFLKDTNGKPLLNFAFNSEEEAYTCGLYLTFEI